MAHHKLNNTSCIPSRDLNSVSFNMNGFNQGILMLKNICLDKMNSVVMTQEHWLNSDQLSYFDVFKSDFYVFGISAMDSTLGQGILRGRPHGGCATFVRKSLANSLGHVECITCAEKMFHRLGG